MHGIRDWRGVQLSNVFARYDYSAVSDREGKAAWRFVRREFRLRIARALSAHFDVDFAGATCLYRLPHLQAVGTVDLVAYHWPGEDRRWDPPCIPRVAINNFSASIPQRVVKAWDLRSGYVHPSHARLQSEITFTVEGLFKSIGWLSAFIAASEGVLSRLPKAPASLGKVKAGDSYLWCEDAGLLSDEYCARRQAWRDRTLRSIRAGALS